MNKLKIKSIKAGRSAAVYDLSVEDNHNFFITDKQILTHNCDYLSPNAQAVLRGLMEKYASTARFIMTCNYPNRVIPALHSRSQGFHIDKVDQTEFTARAAEVLITEGIDFNLDILDSYVKATYPDLRKCLNLLQMNSATGVLAPANTAEIGGSSEDYKLAAVELIKSKQYTKARELICASVRPEEMEPIFRWMYDSLDLWGDTDDQKDAAILTIRDGLVNHSFVADPEINLSATLITLLQGLK